MQTCRIFIFLLILFLLQACSDVRVTKPSTIETAPKNMLPPPTPDKKNKAECPLPPPPSTCISDSPGANGDINKNGKIDADTILEIGSLKSEPNCKSGLHAWAHNSQSSRREPYYTSNCELGYVCTERLCLSEGQYALNAEQCCSQEIDCETGQCLAPLARFK